MASTINTNIASLTAQRNLGMSQASLQTSMQRLSSGLRINSAKDDAAGLAISDRMTSQIRGLNQASRNANDGISLSQTAEGAMGSISTNLQRMRELAVQSANATNSASDRAALQQEVSQLSSEIDRVATQTQFNGINLLDGTFGGANGTFQVGANAGQTISVGIIPSARSSALGAYTGYNNPTLPIGTPSATTGAASISIGATAYALGTIATDAKAIASAASAAGVPGLTVTANKTTVAAATQTLTPGTTPGNVTLSINNVNITIASTGDATANRAAALTAINAQSAATGVIATDTGGGVSLSASDGRNIDIGTIVDAGATPAVNADFGIAAASITGASLNVSYIAPSGSSATLSMDAPGGAAGSLLAAQIPATTGTAVNALDISTVGGANAALTSIDAALATVNTSRASLGAIQNRFLTTIENLNTTSENLSASRSRIQDADFAMETANLSRTQILQQAGTAMVAQANQLPQGVLALLRQ